MVIGRFESGELRREALAHEALTARQGLAGKCWCLVCAFVVAVGLYSVFAPSGPTATLVIPPPEVLQRSSSAPASSPATSSPSPVILPSPGPSPEFGLQDTAPDFQRTREDWSRTGISQQDWDIPAKHLGNDFTLMGILLTAIALCVAPALLRACSTPASPWNGAPGYSPWLGPGGQNTFYAPGAGPGNTLLGSNYARSDNRIIDVKPGELRGGGAGGFFGGGWMDQGAGMDWGAIGRAANPGAAGAWPPLTAQAGTAGGGSWWSPVPSPYSNVGPAGLPGAPGGAGGWPAQLFGLGPAGAHSHGMAGNLPSEAEVTETYASFGSELQQWVPRLMQIIQKEIIEPLIAELEDSDRVWQQALAPRGWRLTAEAPRQTYPGMGPQVQEVSVFDRYLPQQVLQLDPRAVDLWNRRQQLESYLVHPSFPQAQRPYVLTRLREWRDRGLANIMRAEWRQHDQLPTDAHILENLLIKMLNVSMEFDKCFLATPHAPPLAKHLGQSPVAYLRQVTDQSVTPAPPPHYEVLTLTKVWKLRPGNRNLFEALALLVHMLRRHHSRSFQSFPTTLRNAIEPTTMGAIANLPARLFPSLFGGLA